MERDNGTIRQFETGATRDTAQDKLDFEGFLSPLVLLRYAQYMHLNRHQSDGSPRDSDNWQKGIPLEVYAKSGMRHFMDFWMSHRQWVKSDQDIEGAICGVLFNMMGYLHELLKGGQQVPVWGIDMGSPGGDESAVVVGAISHHGYIHLQPATTQDKCNCDDGIGVIFNPTPKGGICQRCGGVVQ